MGKKIEIIIAEFDRQPPPQIPPGLSAGRHSMGGGKGRGGEGGSLFRSPFFSSSISVKTLKKIIREQYNIGNHFDMSNGPKLERLMFNPRKNSNGPWAGWWRWR